MHPVEHQDASHADLVIIGAGPAGLMAAAWASQYPNLCTRIIDSNACRTPTGKADGLVARTLEIFDSFGVADQLYKDAFREIEMCSWTPDANGRIQRTQRIVTQKVGTSRFNGIEIHQGRIEQAYLDWLKVQPSPISVERRTYGEELTLDENVADKQDAYPITLRVRRRMLTAATEASEASAHTEGSSNGEAQVNGIHNSIHNDDADGTAREETETIKAKYLIGCDGAHSWTRQQMKLTMEGESSDHIWGVMDIVPLTDFPDIRQSCAIHSQSHGSIMSVPREGRLLRLYIQLSDVEKTVAPGTRFDASKIQPQTIIKAARKIMHPYRLDYKICDWWSVYQIGQRVAPKFSVANRIFLAGDAVHTHSPKMGQGMNVSMQDTYNLGWKICSVLSGQTQPEILSTYQTERHQVALELIETDQKFTDFYSKDQNGESAEDIRKDNQKFRDQYYDFLSGVGVEYKPSSLVACGFEQLANGDGPHKSLFNQCTTKQHLAPNVKVGRRMPSYRVINQSDVRPVQIGNLLRNNGRWRILIFAGDVREPAQLTRVNTLGEMLASPSSCIHKYRNLHSTSNTAHDRLIELYIIHSAPRIEVQLSDLHEVFHPYDEEVGWDYWRVFTDDVAVHEGFDDAYAKYGIDRVKGCLVVCRPDHHVGYVGALEDVEAVEAYFGGILLG